MSLILLFLAAATFAACGGEEESSDHDMHDGHDHEAGHQEGDGHDHAEHGEDGEEHGSHGERVELGAAKAGPFTVTVAIFGAIKPGEEAVLDIEIEGGSSSAVRAWVGVESGRGSMKSKVDGEDGIHHGHIEVPSSLADGSAIWVEVEAANGARSQASFDLP